MAGLVETGGLLPGGNFYPAFLSFAPGCKMWEAGPHLLRGPRLRMDGRPRGSGDPDSNAKDHAGHGRRDLAGVRQSEPNFPVDSEVPRREQVVAHYLLRQQIVQSSRFVPL